MELIDLVVILNFMLTLGICVLMVTVFKDQQKRIALLEARVSTAGRMPALVDGNNRMLMEPCDAFVTNTGKIWFPKELRVQPEFGGMRLKAYMVIEGN